jgi:hypothetical protein
MNESVLGYSQKELDKIPNYILYIKVLEQLDQTFDNIKEEIRKGDNGSYFSEISNSIDNLVTQTFELNKTMNNIAESLRVISHNNR